MLDQRTSPLSPAQELSKPPVLPNSHTTRHKASFEHSKLVPGQSQQELQKHSARQKHPHHTKPVLKRNIFAGLMTASSLTTKSVYDEASLTVEDPPIHLHESSPMVEDIMLSSSERSIYENLARIGIRMADPMELQYNYYQKVRSAVFNLSSQDRFLSPQLCSLSSVKTLQQDVDFFVQQQQTSIEFKGTLHKIEYPISNLDLSVNRIFNSRLSIRTCTSGKDQSKEEEINHCNSSNSPNRFLNQPVLEENSNQSLDGIDEMPLVESMDPQKESKRNL